jgi:hypothetical protein
MATSSSECRRVDVCGLHAMTNGKRRKARRGSLAGRNGNLPRTPSRVGPTTQQRRLQRVKATTTTTGARLLRDESEWAVCSAQAIGGLLRTRSQSHATPPPLLNALSRPYCGSQYPRPAHKTSKTRRKESQGAPRCDSPLTAKMGHGGTLDPLASGVLVVGVGSGTKKLQDFLGGWKEYETTCVFGIVTDSYDAEGKILQRTSTANITREAVETALESFKGEIQQRPPMYFWHKNRVD